MIKKLFELFHFLLLSPALLLLFNVKVNARKKGAEAKALYWIESGSILVDITSISSSFNLTVFYLSLSID